jgi:hypothetical protein
MLKIENKGHAVYGVPDRRHIFAFRFRGEEQLMLEHGARHVSNIRPSPRGVSDTYDSFVDDVGCRSVGLGEQKSSASTTIRR